MGYVRQFHVRKSILLIFWGLSTCIAYHKEYNAKANRNHRNSNSPQISSIWEKGMLESDAHISHSAPCDRDSINALKRKFLKTVHSGKSVNYRQTTSTMKALTNHSKMAASIYTVVVDDHLRLMKAPDEVSKEDKNKNWSNDLYQSIANRVLNEESHTARAKKLLDSIASLRDEARVTEEYEKMASASALERKVAQKLDPSSLHRDNDVVSADDHLRVASRVRLLSGRTEEYLKGENKMAENKMEENENGVEDRREFVSERKHLPIGTEMRSEWKNKEDSVALGGLTKLSGESIGAELAKLRYEPIEVGLARLMDDSSESSLDKSKEELIMTPAPPLKMKDEVILTSKFKMNDDVIATPQFKITPHLAFAKLKDESAGLPQGKQKTSTIGTKQAKDELVATLQSKLRDDSVIKSSATKSKDEPIGKVKENAQTKMKDEAAGLSLGKMKDETLGMTLTRVKEEPVPAGLTKPMDEPIGTGLGKLKFEIADKYSRMADDKIIIDESNSSLVNDDIRLLPNTTTAVKVTVEMSDKNKSTTPTSLRDKSARRAQYGNDSGESSSASVFKNGKWMSDRMWLDAPTNFSKVPVVVYFTPALVTDRSSTLATSTEAKSTLKPAWVTPAIRYDSDYVTFTTTPAPPTTKPPAPTTTSSPPKWTDGDRKLDATFLGRNGLIMSDDVWLDTPINYTAIPIYISHYHQNKSTSSATTKMAASTKPTSAASLPATVATILKKLDIDSSTDVSDFDKHGLMSDYMWLDTPANLTKALSSNGSQANGTLATPSSEVKLPPIVANLTQLERRPNSYVWLNSPSDDFERKLRRVPSAGERPVLLEFSPVDPAPPMAAAALSLTRWRRSNRVKRQYQLVTAPTSYSLDFIPWIRRTKSSYPETMKRVIFARCPFYPCPQGYVCDFRTHTCRPFLFPDY